MRLSGERLEEVIDVCADYAKFSVNSTAIDRDTVTFLRELQGLRGEVNSGENMTGDFQKWLSSRTGQQCADWPVQNVQFLVNRLSWAFEAGRKAEATEREPSLGVGNHE